MKVSLARTKRFDFASLSLIVANLVPLAGVFLLGWSAAEIIIVYWAENVVIGLVTILKMLTCASDSDRVLESITTDDMVKETLEEWRNADGGSDLSNWQAKLFLTPFFAMHYGLFCFVHGVFVLALVNYQSMGALRLSSPTSLLSRWTSEHLTWAIAALAASHLVSYFVNYLGKGEFRHSPPPILMGQPYGRVIVLHLAILFGASFVMFFDSPTQLLVILVVGKLLLDLQLHWKEQARNSVDDKATQSTTRTPRQADDV